MSALTQVLRPSYGQRKLIEFRKLHRLAKSGGLEKADAPPRLEVFRTGALRDRNLMHAQAKLCKSSLDGTRHGRRASVCGAAGSATVLGAGAAVSSTVPWLMSTYGTVVAGVGTMQAPLAIGGAAATAQATAAVLPSAPAAFGGAAVGVAGYGVYKLARRACSVPAGSSRCFEMAVEAVVMCLLTPRLACV